MPTPTILTAEAIFYYHQKIKKDRRGDTVTDQPLGYFDIQASIAAQGPRWQTVGSETLIPNTERKKVLIFNDKLCPYYSVAWRDEITNTLDDLARKGFKIYAGIDEQLKQISNFNSPEFKKHLTWIDPDNVNKQLTQLKENISNITVLDTIAIQRLVYSNCKPHLLSQNDLLMLKHFEIIHHSRVIQLSVDNPLLAGFHIDSWSQVCVLTETLGENALLRIESLEMSCQRQIKDCFDLLTYLENLQYLALNYIEKPPSFLRLNHALNTIKLETSSFTIHFFFALLTNSLTLENLSLQFCTIEGAESEFSALIEETRWEQLRRIKIEFSTLDIHAIFAVLLRSPNMVSLMITYAKTDNNLTLDLEKFHALASSIRWHNLQTLEIDKLTVSGDVLFELLLRSPNLENLSLGGSTFSTKPRAELFDNLEQHYWSSLKEISLNNSVMLDDVFVELIKRAPNLISLLFSNNAAPLTAAIVEKLGSFNYLSLKRIYVDTLISGDALIALLRRAPNLERLIFHETFATNLSSRNAGESNLFSSLTAESIRQLPSEVQWPNLCSINIKTLQPEFKDSFLSALLKRASKDCRIERLNSKLEDRKLEDRKPKQATVTVPSPVAHQQTKSHVISSDTGPVKETFNPKNQLLALAGAGEIHCRDYRQSIVFSENINLTGQEIVIIELNDTPNTAISYTKFNIYPSLKEFTSNIHEKPEPENYYYEAIVEILPGEQPLVTASVHNNLIAMLEPPPGCDFYYDKDRDQYYVDYKGETATTLRYVLAVPKESPQEALLPEEIRKICEYYKEFKQKPLSSTPDTAAGKLAAMREQRVGSCLQRSIACLAELHEKSIIARLVYNEVHTYLEILIDHQWVRVDLGGYPANINKPFLPTERIELPTPVLQPPLEAQDSVTPEVNPNETASTAQASAQPPSTEIITAALQPPVHSAFEKWFKEITTSHNVKQSWTFSSDQDTQLATTALLHAYQRRKIPVYVVNHPDQLRCLIDALILLNKDDYQGTIKPKPTGPFYDFLRQENPRTLLIDWNAFEPEDVARYLGFLDGNFDGTDIFETINIALGLRVLSLQNTKREDAYRSQDYLTRHGSEKPCPVSIADLCTQASSGKQLSHSEVKILPIDLYSANNWEDYVFGKWLLKPEGFIFQPTECWKALCKGEACELQLMDPPSHLPSFERFKQLIECGLPFSYAGHRFDKAEIQYTLIPTPKEYWQKRREAIRLHSDTEATTSGDQPSWVLNSVSLFSFINTEFIDDAGNLLLMPGLLEQHQGASLSLILSHTLSTSQWAMLLDTAQRYAVNLTISCLAGVSLPRELQEYLPTSTLTFSAKTRLAMSNLVEKLPTLSDTNIDHRQYPHSKQCRIGGGNYFVKNNERPRQVAPYHLAPLGIKKNDSTINLDSAVRI